MHRGGKCVAYVVTYLYRHDTVSCLYVCTSTSFCSRGAQRVLRYGDMEYVMLHLIFIYLTPGEGQPAAYAASDL